MAEEPRQSLAEIDRIVRTAGRVLLTYRKGDGEVSERVVEVQWVNTDDAKFGGTCLRRTEEAGGVPQYREFCYERVKHVEAFRTQVLTTFGGYSSRTGAFRV